MRISFNVLDEAFARIDDPSDPLTVRDRPALLDRSAAAKFADLYVRTLLEIVGGEADFKEHV